MTAPRFPYDFSAVSGVLRILSALAAPAVPAVFLSRYGSSRRSLPGRLVLPVFLLLCAVCAGAFGTAAALDPDVCLSGSGTSDAPCVVDTWDELITALGAGGYVKISDHYHSVSTHFDGGEDISINKSAWLDLNGAYVETDGSISVSEEETVFTLYDSWEHPGVYDFLGSEPCMSVGTGSSIIMNDGTHILIEPESVAEFTGIQVDGGSFIMNGDSYISCILHSEAGKSKITGVTVSGGGSLSMHDDSDITHFLRGVYVNGGSFTMNGGDIISNGEDYEYEARIDGTGVYVADGSSFTMNGGSFTFNRAKNKGGAVYIAAGGSFSLEGAPDFHVNKAGKDEDEHDSNVFLESGAKISIKGKLNNTGKIGISMEAETGGVFTEGYSEYNSTNSTVPDPGDFFTSEQKDQTLIVGLVSGEAALGKPYTITVDSSLSASVTADKTRAIAGETVALTVAEGFSGSLLYEGKTARGQVSSSDHSFTMPAEDVTVRKTAAMIGNTPYASLRDALQDAEEGAVIDLVSDTPLSDELSDKDCVNNGGFQCIGSVIRAEHSVTVNLNGFTARLNNLSAAADLTVAGSGSFTVLYGTSVAGTLTAKNSSTVTVKETLSGLGSLAIEDDSAVVLDSAVIDPSVDPDELKQYAEKEDKEKIKADGSTAVSVTLHKISTYTLSVTAPEFEPVTLGYKQPDPKGITITSIGNSDAEISSVELGSFKVQKGGSAVQEAFELMYDGEAVIKAGTTDDTTYTIRPAEGLDAGTYSAEILVNYNDDDPASAVVSFTVKKAPDPEPEPEQPYRMDFFRLCGDCTLPATGFSALRPEALAEQPKELRYEPARMRLMLPTLDLDLSLVTVPRQENSWAVAWLGDSAGILEGSSLPGKGLSIIAAHNTLNDTAYGPFALLGTLEPEDLIAAVAEDGTLSFFRVYANELLAPDDMESIAALAEENGLVLVTCENESPEGGYLNRRVIFAAESGSRKQDVDRRI